MDGILEQDQQHKQYRFCAQQNTVTQRPCMFNCKVCLETTENTLILSQRIHSYKLDAMHTPTGFGLYVTINIIVTVTIKIILTAAMKFSGPNHACQLK